MCYYAAEQVPTRVATLSLPCFLDLFCTFVLIYTAK